MASDTINHLSNGEKRAIVILAKRFRESGPFHTIAISDLKASNLEEDRIVLDAFDRLFGFKLIDFKTNDAFVVLDELLDIANQIDNPPPCDYFREWTVKWRQYPWVVATVMLMIAIPALAKWYEWGAKGLAALRGTASEAAVHDIDGKDESARQEAVKNDPARRRAAEPE